MKNTDTLSVLGVPPLLLPTPQATPTPQSGLPATGLQYLVGKGGDILVDQPAKLLLETGLRPHFHSTSYATYLDPPCCTVG